MPARSQSSGRGLEAAARAEIDGLHRFFEDWFLGRCPKQPAAFARCADALAPTFVLIGPDGEERRRAGVLKGLRAAHGCHAGVAFAIRIRHARVRLFRPGVALATYEEWQRRAGRETARRSSALLASSRAAPLGVAWLHLHETWIAGYVDVDVRAP
jgi:hypothetical protein